MTSDPTQPDADRPDTGLPGRILVIGLTGAGKSTVGSALARRIGAPYLDNDRVVVEISGRTGPQLESDGGVEALHRVEIAAFLRSLEAPLPVVIGVAGWIVAEPGARATLAAAGTVVWLRARPETLLRRIGSGQGRRTEATSIDWLRRISNERAEAFRSVADVVVDVDRRSVSTVVSRIVEALRPA